MGLCFGKCSSSSKHSPKRYSKIEQVEQQPSLQEAINRLDKSKESNENELEELQQQLKGTKDEKQKEALRRSIRRKERCINNLGNQLDQLYDALGKENQVDIENAIQLSQKYRHMSDDAIRQNDTFRRRVADTAF